MFYEVSFLPLAFSSHSSSKNIYIYINLNLEKMELDNFFLLLLLAKDQNKIAIKSQIPS